MFEHTCFRELEFLRRVNQILHQHGYPVANHPLGALRLLQVRWLRKLKLISGPIMQGGGSTKR
jgi:hypothetical protein